MNTFYDPADFPAACVLEANYPAILAEFQHLSEHHFAAWPEKFLYGEGWSVFGFYDSGVRNAENCAICPQTAAVLDQLGDLGRVGFSRMRPGTHIQPHRGKPKKKLRCHLALIVPEGDAALRVESDIRKWTPGKCMVFDDRLEHEAWNRTQQDRVVLIVDLPIPAKFSRRGR